MISLTFPHVSLLCFATLLQIPDFKEIIEGLKEVLKLIFGDQAPAWIFPIIGYLLLLAAVLTGLLGLLTILSKIKDLLTDKFWPLFYDKEKARRSARRRKFADHIESELRRLNMLEAWSDYRFAELEAEVDAEGRRRLFGILPSWYRTSNTLRREKSLSKALALSDERLIIVEGDPGSGKSVALRHVAILMATRAMKSRSAKSLIPIYVNLKEIERQKEEEVDRNLIEAFVLKALNRVNDRDIEEFLEEEFSDGMQSGTWFFLFDSFDEIPEILSSTEADKTIYQYANAISDFLHGLNQCRGVLASRFFHGPKQFGWPRFSILPLSPNRRTELVKRAGLKSATEVELLGQIEAGRQEIMSMASNPMFLGLLCEHMRSGYQFPENSHSVFQTYVDSRLTRDEERLYRRFELKPEELRATAEAVAFCMAADDGLGLSPSRGQIEGSAERLQINLDKRFDKILDAITFLKLARTDTSTSAEQSKQFTFAHRRFQEYFSTAVVLREPTKVTARQLLSDARWRETAIVLCQTQTAETLSAFVQEADSFIAGFADDIITLNPDTAEVTPNGDGSGDATIPRFQWPQHCLHVLSLLQEGLAKRPQILSDETTSNIAKVLITASEMGITIDQKWALDVSGLTSTPILTAMLRHAFDNRSQVLKDSAYKQVARLTKISTEIASSIRSTLCIMTWTHPLWKDRTATRAHLGRLESASTFLAVLRLLIWLPVIDLCLHVLLAVVLLFNFLSSFSPALLPSSRVIALGIFLPGFAIPMSYVALYWTGFVFGTQLAGVFSIKTPYGRSAEFRLLLVLLIILRFSIIMGSIIVLVGLQHLVDLYPLRVINANGLLIWLYISCWAPAALLFAHRGQFISPFLWPFYPVLVAVTLIKEIPAGLIAMVRDWKDVLKALLATLGLLTAGLLLLYLASLIPYIKSVPVVAVSLVLLYLTYRRIADQMRWRRWNHSKPASIDPEEFIANVRSYKSDKFRARFINAVRTRGLMIVSVESEEAIYNFARELETPPPPNLGHPLFGGLVTALGSNLNVQQVYGVTVLDEVIRLLEQMRAMR